MKKTAVEWLVIHINLGLTYEQEVIFEGLFEKAKEMEKEQIIDFGYDIAEDLACGKYRDKKHMEERYNEFLTYREEDDDI